MCNFYIRDFGAFDSNFVDSVQNFNFNVNTVELLSYMSTI
jgi:hypothetical protein